MRSSWENDVNSLLQHALCQAYFRDEYEYSLPRNLQRPQILAPQLAQKRQRIGFARHNLLRIGRDRNTREHHQDHHWR